MDPIGRIRSILSNYVSPITGEALIAAALRRLRPGAHDLGAANLERIVRALDRGIDLFVAEERRGALRAELAALSPHAPGPLALEIRDEADVERARELASGLCERLGARPSATWKVVSGVVALASRLAARPTPGHIEVIPLPDPPRGIRVRATDREGPASRPPAPSPAPRPSGAPSSAPRQPSGAPSSAPRQPSGAPSSAPRQPSGTPSSAPRQPSGAPSSAPRRPAPASSPGSPSPPPRPPPPRVLPGARPPGALDGALPTIRRVADRFDVRGVGNRTHVEFDVWFSGVQGPR